jgi:hypothetical protein
MATSKVAPPQHSTEKELRHHVRVVRRDGSHVRLPHARSEEGLMRVPHGRVRDEHALLREHPLRETFGAKFIELLLRARRRRLGDTSPWAGAPAPCSSAETPFGFRVAVDDGLADERRMRVARSRFFSHLNSSGVSSMNFVV